jgi:hypothetical protein
MRTIPSEAFASFHAEQHPEVNMLDNYPLLFGLKNGNRLDALLDLNKNRACMYILDEDSVESKDNDQSKELEI